MRKHNLSLLFFQIIASTIVLMAEANTANFDLKNNEIKSAEERDLEIEASQETDVFPDLITFTTLIHQ